MIKISKVVPFVHSVPNNTVFVEIGSERGEGSTLFLADLALKNQVEFYSVDIDNILTKKWRVFYNNVKDPTWPATCADIKDLPQDLKKECIETHGWTEQPITEDDLAMHQLANHSALTLIQAKGSDWCRDFAATTDKKISFLYLDNFDYIYENMDCTHQIKQYEKQFNLIMNNENCQIEHFKQIMYLIPCLHENCVVACDDTYQYNGCWVGKSGAVVVYLLALDFNIIYNKESFVILKRNTQIQ